LTSTRALAETRTVKPSGKSAGKKDVVPTLDLHGFKTDDVFDAVEAFLRKHERLAKVRIMPGKGTGKVKAKVIEYLKLAHFHYSVERLTNGDANEGVLLVYME
jgi:dsDNA-specific endonuclease/ATPase MutS2